MNCSDGKELDEFDNDKTNYIFGVKDNMIVCGTRMIDMKHKNMLNSAFSSFFHDVVIPEGISSSPHAFSSIKKEPSHCWAAGSL